jgi:hypothetical protein
MSSPFQKAFSSKSPLGKVPCKLPYPGKEVAAGKHGGKMTKEMSKANAEAKLKCNQKDPQWIKAQEKEKAEFDSKGKLKETGDDDKPIKK